MHRPAPRPPNPESGIALMIVLLLAMVLIPFAVEFTYQIAMESRISGNVADQLKLDNAIDGQREIVLARIEHDAPDNEYDHYDDGWNDDEILNRSHQLEDGTTVELETTVFDEQGKLNLNNMAMGSDERRQLWKRRFADLIRTFRRDTKYDAAGLADELADDVYRWMNGDSTRGEIPSPRTLDDRKMLVLEELHFINEKFAKERLLEDIPVNENEVAPALHRYITVVGTGKINLNTAPKRLLQALFPQDEEIAERILERRAGGASEEEPADEDEEEEGAEGSGDPFTDVNQVSELDGVNLALLNRNGVDLNQDFDVRSNVFSLRISAKTPITRREELVVVERVPASDPAQPIDGFRFLLHQERTDPLEYGVDDSQIDQDL